MRRPALTRVELAELRWWTRSARIGADARRSIATNRRLWAAVRVVEANESRGVARQARHLRRLLRRLRDAEKEPTVRKRRAAVRQALTGCSPDRASRRPGRPAAPAVDLEFLSAAETAFESAGQVLAAARGDASSQDWTAFEAGFADATELMAEAIARVIASDCRDERRGWAEARAHVDASRPYVGWWYFRGIAPDGAPEEFHDIGASVEHPSPGPRTMAMVYVRRLYGVSRTTLNKQRRTR